MGLLTKKVEVVINSKTIKHYEELGYDIPRIYDKKRNRYTIKTGTKIIVKTEDLSKGCAIKVEVKCDCCGKEYKIEYHNYFRHNHNKKTYCKPCGKKILNSGKNNYLWDNNKTDEERENGRATLSNSEWIKKVLTRDNYTCQCCGKEYDYLNAHHLDSWNWCKEKRYDETNGITLCKICHKNFHSLYGNGDNTKEQFEKWIGHAIELVKYEGILSTTRKVYCVEEDKIYDSADILSVTWGLKNTGHIYDVCNHKPKKYTVKRKHLLWYDEYLQMNDEQINKYLKMSKPKTRKGDYKYGKFNNKSKRIICITTKKDFHCLREAGEYYKIKNYTHINKCCTGKQKTCGKLQDGTRLEWMYYEDYINKLKIMVL